MKTAASVMEAAVLFCNTGRDRLRLKEGKGNFQILC